ncbi:lipopolysaccharide biosynthesis protein [Paracoccus ravus]|uniref:lipopolysaccharide biosynthesis protein n=1 Tax=Paracoccus ravus TaxID=2447760 RepID=UPI00106E22AE|nr:lipopolysaccharide biosynthesis protein [Paracoccus ravus]
MGQSFPDALSHYQSGRARRAFTGVLWSGINALLPAAAGLVVFLVVSRVIGPAELGHVALAAAIIGLLGAFSPAGFGDALVQRVDLSPVHLNATFWLCLLWGVGLYGIAVALAFLLRDPMLRQLMPVLALRLIPDLGSVVPSALLSRQMQFRRLALRTLISSVLSMLASLVVLGLGYGLWALVTSQLAGAMVVCVVSWWSIRWRPSWRIDKGALRELAGFGGFASGSRLITSINLDQLLIGALLGSTALGVFSFARRIFQMLNDVLTGALAAVAYPLLSSMQTEPDKLREAYLATTFLSALLAFPVFTGLGIVGGQLIPLVFGGQWNAATSVLQAFCAIGLLSCIGILQAALIRAKGRADWWMWYQTLQQILTGLIIVALFPYGVTVVVVAIAAKTWVVWPVAAAAAGRMIDLPFGRYVSQFLAPILGCMVMAAVLIALREGVAASPGLLVAMQIGGGVLAYGLTVLFVARNRVTTLRQTIARKS